MYMCVHLCSFCGVCVAHGVLNVCVFVRARTHAYLNLVVVQASSYGVHACVYIYMYELPDR